MENKETTVIKILSLELSNFKGIQHRLINFGNETVISGGNDKGKTTIHDAFRYLLFGTDSANNKTFNIKTLDKDNNPIHNLEHTVIGVISVNGREHTLRRTFREKWVKPRGAENAEFKGNETLYFWNDIPLKESEYNARVDNVLNESVARLVTTATYFVGLEWTKQRAILEQMASHITDAAIGESNPEFMALLNQLNGKTFAEFKASKAATKKKLKDEIDAIPHRIDEANRSKPQAIDIAAKQKEIGEKENELKAVEDALNGEDEANQLARQAYNKKLAEKRALEQKLTDLEHANTEAYKKQLRNLESDANTIAGAATSLRRQAKDKEAEKNRLEKAIETLEGENAKLRSEYTQVSMSTFTMDESKCECPTCKRKFDSTKVEEITKEFESNFNEAKANKLEKINETGGANSERIKQHRAAIEVIEKEQSELESQAVAKDQEREQVGKTLAELTAPQDTAEITDLRAQIQAFELPQVASQSNSELLQQKQALNTAIQNLHTEIKGQEQIARIDARVSELNENRRNYSQQLAEIEKAEFQIEQFTKAKVQAIEDAVNSKFSVVKFKLFRKLNNGGEEPCCEVLIDGVPYADLNTAKKLNAGIDIVNALSAHYGLYAPLWLDNRESVTETIPVKTQVVNIRVVPYQELEIISK